MASLLVLEGPHAGAQLELAAETTVGRSPTCDLVIDDSNVSRRHAQIVVQEGAVRLVDLGSRNGTLLNGERVDGDSPLRPGDRIQVGPSLFAFDPDPLRLFAAEPAAEASFALDRPAVDGVPIPAALRQVLELATRAPTPAAALRIGLEQALALLGAERGLLLALPESERGEAPEGSPDALRRSAPPELLGVAGSTVFASPLEFEALLRSGRGALAAHHLAVPLSLPSGSADRRAGALVVRRDDAPFASEDGALLFDLAGLVSRLAEGAQARQERRSTAFPLVLWRERPALLSPSFRRCLERVGQAARHHGPLLLIGEPATSRDELALTVHQLGRRGEGPFVAWRPPPADPLQPDRLPPSESLVNALQRAEGGTLFLGDFSGWSSELGAAWTQALDRHTPALISNDARVPGAVRLIAASAEPVAKLRAQGRLPAALVQRFDGEKVDVPPLRKRRGDLPLLVERLSAAAAQRLGRSVPRFSAAALKALGEYSWPGNLAELQICLEWALFACGPETEVQLWDLPPQIRAGEALDRERAQPLAMMIAALERTAIVEALREANFKKIHAAAALGISRPTLDKKIVEYQIRLKP